MCCILGFSFVCLCGAHEPTNARKQNSHAVCLLDTLSSCTVGDSCGSISARVSSWVAKLWNAHCECQQVFRPTNSPTNQRYSVYCVIKQVKQTILKLEPAIIWIFLDQANWWKSNWLKINHLLSKTWNWFLILNLYCLLPEQSDKE